MCERRRRLLKMRLATRSFLVILAIFTAFFVALYTIVGISSRSEPRIVLEEPIATVNINDLLSNVSIEERLACPSLYQRWPPKRTKVHRLRFHQTPCRLGDLDDFEQLINADICGRSDVYIVVLVGSHPKHWELREAIRRTWGQPSISGFPFRLAFLFGRLADDEQQKLLEEEHRRYGDILQGNFIDSYANVTLRDLMGLRWAWQFCNQAKFVMHADDDVSIDVYGLIDALEGGAADFNSGKDFVGCFQTMVNTPVLRTGKYMVNKTEHPSDVYDPYCQGWMYITTPHMAYILDLAALKIPPYWMNDAYITGSLVRALGKTPSNLSVNYTITVPDLVSVLKRNSEQKPLYTVEPTGANVTITYKLHDNYRNYAILNRLPRSKWTKKRSTKSTTVSGDRKSSQLP